MTRLRAEVLQLTRNYVRSGGKSNRRQQLQRMLSFADFCHNQGARSMGQIGRKHVMDYYRANKKLSYPTLYSHFLAIAKLYELTNKKEPPRPYKRENFD